MATNLAGYGPHSITTDDDYDLKCVGVDGRPALLTVGLESTGGYNGSVTFKTRRRGSSDTFVTKAYTLPDGTVASAALASPVTHVQMDVTGLDVRVTTSGRSAGTLRLSPDVATEQ